MESWTWIAIGVAAAVVVLAVVLAIGMRPSRRARTQLLRRRFGDEYDRAVDERGSRSAGERELATRVRQRGEIEVRDLAPALRERYTAEWADVQARFVDDPPGAAEQADRLVRRLLTEIGYATDPDDEDGVRLVSVDEPTVVSRYRHGHDLVADRARTPEATERLREAMVDFRAAFESLLHDRRAA